MGPGGNAFLDPHHPFQTPLWGAGRPSCLTLRVQRCVRHAVGQGEGALGLPNPNKYTYCNCHYCDYCRSLCVVVPGCRVGGFSGDAMLLLGLVLLILLLLLLPVGQ